MLRRCGELTDLDTRTGKISDDNDFCIEMWNMLQEYAEDGGFQAKKQSRKRAHGEGGRADTDSDSDDDGLQAKKHANPSVDRNSILSLAKARLHSGK